MGATQTVAEENPTPDAGDPTIELTIAPPTATPEASTATPAPTDTPAATSTPAPTETPVPTGTPEVRSTAAPAEPATATPVESPEATATPVPTATPPATKTPAPVRSAAVVPAIALSRTSGVVGTAIVASVSGFKPGEVANLVWLDGSVSRTLVSGITVSSKDAREIPFTIPTAVRGSHRIRVQGSLGSRANSAVRVTSSMALSPRSGARGAIVKVGVNGYGPGIDFDVRWFPALDNVATPSVVASATTSTLGSASVTFAVPRAGLRRHRVEARERVSLSLVAGEFTVICPSGQEPIGTGSCCRSLGTRCSAGAQCCSGVCDTSGFCACAPGGITPVKADDRLCCIGAQTASGVCLSPWPAAARIDEWIDRVARANGRPSPLAGMGARFHDHGAWYQLNPAALLAIIQRETQCGADGAFLPTTHNNFGNMTGTGDAGSVSFLGRTWASYSSAEVGLQAVFARLRRPVYEATDGSMAGLMNVYAPEYFNGRLENNWTAMFSTFAAVGAFLEVPIGRDFPVREGPVTRHGTAI